MVKDKVVQVSEASDAVAESVVKVVGSIHEALKDGFQPGQDLPKIVGDSFQELVVAVSKAKDVPAEPMESMPAFLMAWSVGGAKVAGVLIPQPKAPSA